MKSFCMNATSSHFLTFKWQPSSDANMVFAWTTSPVADLVIIDCSILRPYFKRIGLTTSPSCLLGWPRIISDLPDWRSSRWKTTLGSKRISMPPTTEASRSSSIEVEWWLSNSSKALKRKPRRSKSLLRSC